jgi:hypothetical protein
MTDDELETRGRMGRLGHKVIYDKSLRDKISALENRINELEKDKRRDFLRSYNYFRLELDEFDPQTINVIKKLEEENGVYKMIPYLSEFYKRISQPKFFGWWINLSFEQKETEFRKIIGQVDSNWGETYMENEDKEGKKDEKIIKNLLGLGDSLRTGKVNVKDLTKIMETMTKAIEAHVAENLHAVELKN